MESVQVTLDGATIEALQRLLGQVNAYQAKRQTMIATVVETPEELKYPDYRMEMAKRIHGTRSRLGKTREEVAEAAKITVRELEQLEAGTYFSKSGSVLFDIAEALGVHAFAFDPRFDEGGPLSSIQAPERLADNGRD